MKKKITRILAVILSILTLFSSFPAFALTEGNSYAFDEKHLDAYYDTGRWETADGHVHDDYGQVTLRNLKSTGEPIYCIQIYNGAEGSAATAKSIEDTNLWQNEYTRVAKSIVTRVSIWGYPNYSYGYSDTNAQLATQVLIWEAETGARTDYSTGCTSWAKGVFNNYPDALKCYNEILKACQNHSDVPSFYGTTVTLRSTGEANALTLTDTNGILSQFDIESSNDNIKTSVSGNDLKIWCTDADNYSGTLTLTKQKTDINSAFALTGANQTLFYGTLADPVNARVTVNVEAEKKFNVSVEKQSSLTGETLTGASFKVQQWSASANAYEDYKTLTATGSGSSTRYVANDLVVTDDNGGKFKLVETKVPDGYSNDPTFSSKDIDISDDGVFQVGSNVTDGITFYFVVKNEQIRGGISGSKVLLESKDNELGDVKLNGIKFAVVSDNDGKVQVNGTEYTKGQVVAIVTTNANGDFTSANDLLPYGNYTLYELRRDSGVGSAKLTIDIIVCAADPLLFTIH